MYLPFFLYHFVAAACRSKLGLAELHAFQNRRAREMVAWARLRSPFYRRHFEGHEKVPWHTLPTVDKHLMMTHFDEFNTVGIGKSQAMEVALRAETTRNFLPTLLGHTVGLSSGTSGHRGLFLVSPQEQAAWAGHLLARTLPSLRPQGFSVAFFLRSNSNLYESLGGRWLRFRHYDLMLPIEKMVEKLNLQQPDFLVAPASLLGLLAKSLTTGTLRIRPLRLISVAEVLEPQDKELLEATFACPVHQIYQCTEGLLAISCQHGSLHLQEDLVAVQLEPIPGTHEIPPRFSPIVTDLWRRTQPILRYRLNDIVSLDDRFDEKSRCPCGSAFRVLATIEGRCDDLLEFDKQDGGRRFIFPDAIRRIILLCSPKILDYQAVQERPGQLRIHLDLVNDVDFQQLRSELNMWIERTMAENGCKTPNLSIERGLAPSDPRKKRRRIRREY